MYFCDRSLRFDLYQFESHQQTIQPFNSLFSKKGKFSQLTFISIALKSIVKEIQLLMEAIKCVFIKDKTKHQPSIRSKSAKCHCYL